MNAAENFLRRRATTQFHTFLLVLFGQPRQYSRRHRLMHQQGFHCIADAITMGLGVEGHGNRLVDIGAIININMTNAMQMFDHRHPRIGADAFDQALAAARHDHVHIFRHADQFTHRRAIRRIQHLHHIHRQAGFFQPLMDAGGDGLIGMQRFGTTAQDRGIARLHAQSGGIGGDVGPGFVNNANHAQRHAHLANLNAGRTIIKIGDLTDGIRQGGNLTQTFGHARNAFRIEFQPVQQRGVQPFVAPGRHVFIIGLDQTRRLCFQQACNRQQRIIFYARTGARQHP